MASPAYELARCPAYNARALLAHNNLLGALYRHGFTVRSLPLLDRSAVRDRWPRPLSPEGVGGVPGRGYQRHADEARPELRGGAHVQPGGFETFVETRFHSVFAERQQLELHSAFVRLQVLTSRRRDSGAKSRSRMQQIGHLYGGRFFFGELRGRARSRDVKQHQPRRARRETLTALAAVNGWSGRAPERHACCFARDGNAFARLRARSLPRVQRRRLPRTAFACRARCVPRTQYIQHHALGNWA
jgi:hypothetical protein